MFSSKIKEWFASRQLKPELQDTPLVYGLAGLRSIRKAIREGLVCLQCEQLAVTFHGMPAVTHGFCERHRCCATCGGKIEEVAGIRCKCKEPAERHDYLAWKESGPWLTDEQIKNHRRATDQVFERLKQAIDAWHPKGT